MEVWVARVTDVRIFDMSTRNRTTVRVELLRERGMSRECLLLAQDKAPDNKKASQRSYQRVN